MDLVGSQHHHDVGGCDSSFHQCSLKTCRLRLEAASRSAAKPHDHVDAAIVEVQRLRAALVAVTEDGNALARERSRVDMGVAEQLHGAAPSYSLRRGPAHR